MFRYGKQTGELSQFIWFVFGYGGAKITVFKAISSMEFVKMATICGGEVHIVGRFGSVFEGWPFPVWSDAA